MNIFERFKHLSKSSFDFDFEKYLNDTRKSFFIFKIDTKAKKYIPIWGSPPFEILEGVNNYYIHAEAGFSVDVNNHFKSKIKSDLLLISDTVLATEQNNIETILIHELAHFMIDSGQHVDISKEADELGVQLYGRTDQENELATRHTIVFCKVLSQGCINDNKIGKKFPDNWGMISNAMRFDLF